jgi:hypothetical protein
MLGIRPLRAYWQKCQLGSETLTDPKIPTSISADVDRM